MVQPIVQADVEGAAEVGDQEKSEAYEKIQVVEIQCCSSMQVCT